MTTTFKPIRFVQRLWVFSCLVGSVITSCQPSGSPTQTSPQPPPPKIKTPSHTGFEGLSLEAASAKAQQAKLRWRVVRVDGKGRPVTKDYRPQRLNFEITEGKVSRVTKG